MSKSLNSRSHDELMKLAIEYGDQARLTSPPNPWVGSVILSDGALFFGCTQSPGMRHAEVVALDAAGDAAKGSTLYTTLEPCAHQGKTPPCARAIVKAGVTKVVIGLEDPDSRVRGRGVTYLSENGVDVVTRVLEDDIKLQLAPYLKQRLTGLPWVVLKLATTLDGRIAASDGTSNWITGDLARGRVQVLRAESQVIIVGANTVTLDDPALTVRDGNEGKSPRRIVLGKAPNGSRVLPAREFMGDVQELLSELGGNGVISVLVEGGAKVAKAFLEKDLVDEYVFHVAPAIFGGSNGVSAFAGLGAETIADLKRLDHKSTAVFDEDTEIISWSPRASRLINDV